MALCWARLIPTIKTETSQMGRDGVNANVILGDVDAWRLGGGLCILLERNDAELGSRATSALLLSLSTCDFLRYGWFFGSVGLTLVYYLN